MVGTRSLGLALTLVSFVGLVGCATFGGTDPYTGKGALQVSEAKRAILAGDLDEAQKSLNEAVAKGPSAEAHYYLALAALEKDPENGEGCALAEVSDSLRDHPTPKAFLLRGALIENSNPTEAIRCYKAGLSQTDVSSETRQQLRRNLAVLLAREERTDEAYESMRDYVEEAQVRKKSLTDGDYALWGYLLYEKGLLDQAHATWASIRSKDMRNEIAKADGGS